MVDFFIAQQPLPCQSLDLVRHLQRRRSVPRFVVEDGGAPRGEGVPLGDEVVPDEAEGALRQQVGADVEVTGVAGAEGQGVGGEAVLGDVAVGGGEDGLLGGAEDARRRRVVIGVVVGRARRGSVSAEGVLWLRSWLVSSSS